jgi:hypothetical protein
VGIGGAPMFLALRNVPIVGTLSDQNQCGNQPEGGGYNMNEMGVLKVPQYLYDRIVEDAHRKDMTLDEYIVLRFSTES